MSITTYDQIKAEILDNLEQLNIEFLKGMLTDGFFIK